VSVREVEAGGVALAVEDSGTGDPVVFVHGTATGRAVWRETIDALAGAGLRTIVYDRRAYGDSGAPEPYGGTTVGEQADDLAELIEALDAAPALLVGHELGALAALDLMLRHRRLARGAVLVEPSMLWLSPAGPDAISTLRVVVEKAAYERGAEAAVAAFLEAVDGPRAVERLGPERAHVPPRAFAADMAAAASWPAGRRELRQIEAPVTVVSGSASAPVRRESAAALVRLLPNATLVEVGAGHLAHVEAPGEVAAAISRAV
jgi:pimeloyl-ACP methyl ester carboxylesterase